ncbi:glucose-6-phosphate isomerase [Balneolaceae bacterium ANBcel3]|nr:glucose-6-phosphate isomerase [Balneolaceae bacterium ANBcel3]
MFKIDSARARAFVTDKQWRQSHERVMISSKSFDDRTGEGTEWLGWQSILAEPNDALLENLDSVGSDINKKADIFIICGIGGSYLGAKAVIDALHSGFQSDGPEIIYAGHQISGSYLKDLVAYLETPKPDGSRKEVYMNVISKSGTTMETAVAFRVLRKWMHDQYGDEAISRIYCTTSREGGALNKIIRAHGYRKFILPDDVGGRFSVLTPVGLLPIAVTGINIKQLFYGAVDAYRFLDENRTNLLEYVTARYALYNQGFAIDLISTFEPDLVSFGGWLQQLYGESEGKNGQGLFPAVAQYSTDLHSLGQMVQDGKRNIIETFITVDKPGESVIIEEDPRDYDGLNYLAGKSMEEINSKAYQGTLQAHLDGGVPVFTAHLEKRNEESLGQAIYYFELATALFVYAIGENPFDQPGVEDYKKAMYQLLGKK